MSGRRLERGKDDTKVLDGAKNTQESKGKDKEYCGGERRTATGTGMFCPGSQLSAATVSPPGAPGTSRGYSWSTEGRDEGKVHRGHQSSTLRRVDEPQSPAPAGPAAGRTPRQGGGAVRRVAASQGSGAAVTPPQLLLTFVPRERCVLALSSRLPNAFVCICPGSGDPRESRSPASRCRRVRSCP